MSAEGVWPVNIYLTFASSAAYDKLGQITKKPELYMEAKRQRDEFGVSLARQNTTKISPLCGVKGCRHYVW